MAQDKGIAKQAEEETIKDRYIKLQKSFNLPSFDELNSLFEISCIDEDEFLLRAIRRRIVERGLSIAKFLGEVLQPEPQLANMIDSDALDDKEKKKLFEIYKKLMVFERRSIVLNISPDDKKEAEFISSHLAYWKGIQRNLIVYIEKIMKSWEIDKESGEKLGYMG